MHSTKAMNDSRQLLSAYMLYVADDGVDLERFVECGGRLVARGDSVLLSSGLTNLGEKIACIGDEHLRLARQLEFLADFVHAGAAAAPPTARNEALFALLYAATDSDLISDHLPGVGLADDEAVIDLVLTRHADVFERHCAARGLPWDSVKPRALETSNALLLSTA